MKWGGAHEVSLELLLFDCLNLNKLGIYDYILQNGEITALYLLKFL